MEAEDAVALRRHLETVEPLRGEGELLWLVFVIIELRAPGEQSLYGEGVPACNSADFN